MRLAGLMLLGLFVGACSGDNPGGGGADGCQANADCGGGAVCNAGVCEQLCSSDLGCAEGEICSDSICAPGQRDTPVITGVDGDGSEECPDADGSHCISAGLLVTGENLEGAGFELVADSGSAHELTILEDSTDTLSHLALPADVATGTHTLVATNAAGSADQTFDMIQGPRGPPGEDGSADTPDQVLDKLLEVDGEGSGLDADTVDGVGLTALRVPIGTVVPFAGGASSLPDGWLLCDGSEVDRAEYAALFSVIGVAHGAGDQVSTFQLPDLRGRFIRGVDHEAGHDPDAAGRSQPASLTTGGNNPTGNPGDAVGSLQMDQFQTHHHEDNFLQRVGSGTDQIGTTDDNVDYSAALRPPANGRHGSETRPVNLYMNYIIKY